MNHQDLRRDMQNFTAAVQFNHRTSRPYVPRVGRIKRPAAILSFVFSKFKRVRDRDQYSSRFNVSVRLQ